MYCGKNGSGGIICLTKNRGGADVIDIVPKDDKVKIDV
jgi:hypothetical protein